jgi:hypothetical protein
MKSQLAASKMCAIPKPFVPHGSWAHDNRPEIKCRCSANRRCHCRANTLAGLISEDLWCARCVARRQRGGNALEAAGRQGRLLVSRQDRIGLGDPLAIIATFEAVIGLFIELILTATFSNRFLTKG